MVSHSVSCHLSISVAHQLNPDEEWFLNSLGERVVDNCYKKETWGCYPPAVRKLIIASALASWLDTTVPVIEKQLYEAAVRFSSTDNGEKKMYPSQKPHL